MNKLKVFNPYDPSSKGYHLSAFIRVDKRNGKPFSRRVVFGDFLKQYGIHLEGQTDLCYPDKNPSGVKVYHCVLHKDIPVENIGIIEQMYGFKDSLISICIDQNDDRWFSFWFNTENHFCELVRFSWGRTTWSKMYPSFAEMMTEIRSVEKIDDLSELNISDN